MAEKKNIVVLDEPIDVAISEWMVKHPDCDTIIEDIEESKGQRIRVFAYALTEVGNDILEKLRNRDFSHKIILKGISRYAIGGIV